MYDGPGVIQQLRLIYFLYYAGVGSFLFYFAPYLRGLGFSGAQIGAAIMTSQIVSAFAALGWGAVADRLGDPARTLRLCAAGALLAVCGLPFARTPLQVGLVLSLAATCSGSVVPLLDSVTVTALRMGYARTRLFGSVGFIVAAQGLGLLLSGRGDRPADLLMPLVFVACTLGYALTAQTLLPVPNTHARLRFADAAALLSNTPLLVLLAICTLHWACCAPYHLMFGVLIRDHGLPSSLTGLGSALGVLAEVFALLLFPALERRFSLRALLGAAFAVTALRWMLVARAQSAQSLVLLQLLHGMTFGLWWGCAVEAMARLVPARLRSTGQALFSAVVFGLGNAAGVGLSGIGYDRFGSAGPLFDAAALVELAPLLLVLLLARPLSLQRLPA